MDRFEQLKNHSELCVCLHQYPAPQGRKRKRKDRDSGKGGRDRGRKDGSKVGWTQQEIRGRCIGRKDAGEKLTSRKRDGRIDPEK